MGSFQDTFRRYEMKYLLDEEKYHLLRERLQEKMEMDHFGKVTICNIYFDTPEHLLIRTSLDKPVYKEKLRLRSYGIPEEGDKVFVEIKKKYKGVVYKRREKLELTDAEHYLYDNYPSKKQTQITKEIDYQILLKDSSREKAFIDELRCRNGNLEISCGRVSNMAEEL